MHDTIFPEEFIDGLPLGNQFSQYVNFVNIICIVSQVYLTPCILEHFIFQKCENTQTFSHCSYMQTDVQASCIGDHI